MSHSDAVPNNISLRGIDLSNMPEVKIEEVPGKRSYGRRFRVVIDGHTSEEMVMKKMLKQIHKISKVDKALPSEEKLAKLKSVQKLLVELKNANTSANENYDKRGCWYKFRTWFHRLGNKGTHEEKIAKLEEKLEQKITTLEEGALAAEELIRQRALAAEELIRQRALAAEELRLNPPLAISSKPIKTFLEDNLRVFQGAISVVPDHWGINRHGNPRQLKIDGYDVITTKNPTKIVIKDGSSELKISFRDGKISEVLLQNETLDSIPEQFVPILEKAFESAITSASSYNRNNTDVVQTSIKEFPAWHLNKLSEVKIKPSLEQNSKYNVEHDFGFRINFIDDDLQVQRGIDAGGLKRAYVSTLAESIANQKSLFSECQHGLKCPRIAGSQTDILSYCTKDEEAVYYNLGMLLRCNYNSDSITTGVYFNDVLFNTALNFDYSELHTPFVELTRETHLRLALALVEELPTDPDGKEKANMLIALDLCDPAKLNRRLDQLNDKDEEVQKKALKELTTAAMVGAFDPGMQAYIDDEGFEANPEYIKENKEAFINQLYESIFKSKSFVGELNGASLGQVLSPIHNVARGMAVNDNREWDRIKTEGFHAFSLKTQGEIDRQKIHDALPQNAYGITRELNWLKEWVKAETTTNEDIQNFLKFATGSASLPAGKRIEVQRCNGSHPVGHTCFYRVDLPQVASKDKFIENLKEAILTQDFAIS